MPQLNGKTKRLNQILLDKTQALLYDSGIEKKLWVETTYVLHSLSVQQKSYKSNRYYCI